jgi:hypothetical protein
MLLKLLTKYAEERARVTGEASEDKEEVKRHLG